MTMRRSRKIRTKSTDSLTQARSEVAAEAARIIATEGQHDYHAAKKKAATRMGMSDRAVLPSNLEVKDALRTWQKLYGGEQYTLNLRNMRMVAMDVMQMLDQFNPRLVGSVLDGTANEHSRVALHIFCDAPDELIFHFLDQNREFEQEQRQIRWHDGSHRFVPIVVIVVGGIPVELTVFDRLQLRQAPPSPIDGKPQIRATLNDLAELLNPGQLSADRFAPEDHHKPGGDGQSW
jgi:hypothetical protein